MYQKSTTLFPESHIDDFIQLIKLRCMNLLTKSVKFQFNTENNH